MNIKQLRDAMRNPMYDDKPNICGRTFVVYISKPDDIKVCVDYIGNRCYRWFFKGQMEWVLDELVCISFIKTPADLLEVVRELRKLGIRHKVEVEVEYIQGYPMHLTAK